MLKLGQRTIGMFKKGKSEKITVRAPLRFAPQEDQHKGWIRISEELRGGIDSGSYVKLHGNDKTVYCQVRGTPRKLGIIQMNEYYRLKFGWQNPRNQVEITVQRVGFWNKLRAISSHPDAVVRIGFGLGCISVGLGCLSVLFVGLSPSVVLIMNTSLSYSSWGVAGLTVSFIFATIGVVSIVIGIKSILSKS